MTKSSLLISFWNKNYPVPDISILFAKSLYVEWFQDVVSTRDNYLIIYNPVWSSHFLSFLLCRVCGFGRAWERYDSIACQHSFGEEKISRKGSSLLQKQCGNWLLITEILCLKWRKHKPTFQGLVFNKLVWDILDGLSNIWEEWDSSNSSKIHLWLLHDMLLLWTEGWVWDKEASLNITIQRESGYKAAQMVSRMAG